MASGQWSEKVIKVTLTTSKFSRLVLCGTQKPKGRQSMSSIFTVPPRPYIQQHSYHVSKWVVHEINVGDIAIMQIVIVCAIVTGILILVGSWRSLNGHDNFKIVFLIFSNICCWYILELPGGNSNV